jgi:hypothetical protein
MMLVSALSTASYFAGGSALSTMLVIGPPDKSLRLDDVRDFALSDAA